VEDCYEKCRQILTVHRDKLDLVAAKLLEQEKLDGDEFRSLMESAPAAETQGDSFEAVFPTAGHDL
jgi:cell division protease FtsH